MQNLLRYLTDNSLVLFAGAGVSMGPPANLPSWFGLNDLLMEALLEKIQREYRSSDLIRDDFLQAFTASRGANRFSPDYQAQIMEDQAGIDYFRSLSAVDAKVSNPSHQAVAILAGRGCLRAVITPNFDTMFEQAFTQSGVAYEAFYDNAGYERLSALLMGEAPLPFIPIIKIHGTAADPGSMVDTLKQRLKGRSALLCGILQYYLERYYFLYAGFSGADLDFDANYLGIQAAAVKSPGFCFTTRRNGSVRASIQRLMQVYGPKAEVLAMDANELFNHLLQSQQLPLPVAAPEESGPGVVRDRLTVWVDSIDPMKAVIMVNALLESLAIESVSRAFLDRIWRRRYPADYETESFPIFLRNLGRSFVFNFQDRHERAEAAQVYIHTVSLTDTARTQFAQYTYDLYDNVGKGALHHQSNFKTAAGFALFNLMKCFEGNKHFWAGFPDGFLNYEQMPGAYEQADIIYYFSFYADLCADYSYFRVCMDWGIRYVSGEHDWIREGFLRARFAQVLAGLDTGLIQARAECGRALRIAGRLHDHRMLAEARLAKGAIQRQTKAVRSSIQSLLQAKSHFLRVLRFPQVLICNIELLRAFYVVFSDNMAELVPQANALANDIRSECEAIFQRERLNGFEPTFCYSWGWLLWFNGDESREQAMRYFTDAYNLAVAFDQPRLAALYHEVFVRNHIWESIQHRIKQ